MKKVKRRKIMKLSNKLLIILGLIIFFTSFFLNHYFKNINPKLIELSRQKINKMTKQYLSNNIGFKTLNNVGLDKILIITKNKEDEILYVDYDLEKAYEVLDIVTKEISNSINNLEKGNFDDDFYNEYLYSSDHGLMLKVPLFLSSNNALLSNIGPKIYMNSKFTGAVLTNIKSKITNYGMNNALVELYITIEISEKIITPVVFEEELILYDVLIAAKVINGRLPSYYGNTLSKESSILDIPLK
ncbi:MAG: sporulation protein YunB [Bacilli bacterium]